MSRSSSVIPFHDFVPRIEFNRDGQELTGMMIMIFFFIQQKRQFKCRLASMLVMVVSRDYNSNLFLFIPKHHCDVTSEFPTWIIYRKERKISIGLRTEKKIKSY